MDKSEGSMIEWSRISAIVVDQHRQIQVFQLHLIVLKQKLANIHAAAIHPPPAAGPQQHFQNAALIAPRQGRQQIHTSSSRRAGDKRPTMPKSINTMRFSGRKTHCPDAGQHEKKPSSRIIFSTASAPRRQRHPIQPGGVGLLQLVGRNPLDKILYSSGVGVLPVHFGHHNHRIVGKMAKSAASILRARFRRQISSQRSDLQTG